MKKYFGILVLVMVSVSMFGQTETTPTVSKYNYCELLGTANLMQTKVTVEMDFGQETKWTTDTRYKDPNTGKPKKFNSMVDAMNFMGEQGWEFVQAYVVTSGSQNVYRWLLKKTKTE